MAQIGTTSAEELSIQARAEQLEGAISEAHKIVSRIMPDQGDGPDSPKESGAGIALLRCMADLISLNNRLDRLAEKIGLL